MNQQEEEWNHSNNFLMNNKSKKIPMLSNLTQQIINKAKNRELIGIFRKIKQKKEN